MGCQPRHDPYRAHKTTSLRLLTRFQPDSACFRAARPLAAARPMLFDQRRQPPPTLFYQLSATGGCSTNALLPAATAQS
jgi:hypothetical protein